MREVNYFHCSIISQNDAQHLLFSINASSRSKTISHMVSMASCILRLCRLCHEKVKPNRSVYLFSHKGQAQEWTSKIGHILDLHIAADDGLSQYMCQKYKLRLLSLERSLEDLSNFKQLARSLQSAATLQEIRGPLKRTKNTASSDIGLSPDTQRQRPPSKLSRKRLSFESNIFTNEINK